MNIDDLIETLVEARSKGIKYVETKEVLCYNSNGKGSEELYDELCGVYVDEQRRSVVLDLDGL